MNSTSASAAPAGMLRALQSGFAGLIVGLMSVVFVISFAAIVYNGPMTAYLSRGIGMALLGATLMAGLGMFLFSYRGTICQPQDVTAILIAIAAGGVAASGLEGEALFATIATMTLIATFLTGLAAYAFGRLGLGFVARFIPYPVLAGFLAATGYLLTAGAIGMIVGHGIDLFRLPEILRPDELRLWLPWMLAAVGIVIATRALPHPLVLPGLLCLLTIGFYALLFGTGGDLASAREGGLLLGPFEDASFFDTLTPAFVLDANYGILLAQAPTFLAVIAMAIIGALLNATGLAVTLDGDVDLDQDLRAVGLCNLAGSAGGGLVGFHLLGETLIARRLGLIGPVAGLGAALGTGLALLFGAGVLSILPVGLFAAVIGYLGLDLLYTWLWVERRNLPAQDYGLVLLILAAAAAVGFLPALTIGLLAAALLFIYSYARIDTVRLRSTLASRRSHVERDASAEAVLIETGSSTLIYELSGYIFFGTANRLGDQLSRELFADGGITRLILDFTRVPDLDASAAFALEKLAKRCAGAQVQFWCSGVDPARQTRFPARRLNDLGAEVLPSLNDALERAESDLLTTHAEQDGGFLACLAAEHPDLDLDAIFTRLTLAAGEELVTEGAQSTEMFVLLSGTLEAQVRGVDGTAVTVSRFLPGSLVGEIAYYAQVPRTAAIRAAEASEVVRLDSVSLQTGEAGADIAEAVHKLAAGYLARRVMRMTRMLRAGGF